MPLPLGKTRQSGIRGSYTRLHLNLRWFSQIVYMQRSRASPIAAQIPASLLGTWYTFPIRPLCRFLGGAKDVLGLR